MVDEEEADRIALSTLDQMDEGSMPMFIEIAFSQGPVYESIRERVERLWVRINNEDFKQAYRSQQQSSGQGGV